MSRPKGTRSYDRTRPGIQQFLIGIALAAVAVGGQAAIYRIGGSAPLLLTYPTVIVAAWYYGPWASAAAIICETLGIAWFLPPATSFAIAATRDALELALFVVLSSFIAHAIVRERSAIAKMVEAQGVAAAAEGTREAMIAVVAHDLRNPLQTISLNAELLASRTALDVRMTMALDRLRRASMRARHLVENIIESAHSGRNMFPLEWSTCTVSDLVDETIAPFEPLATNLDLRLERPVGDILLSSVTCDRERVVQTLTALLSNALRFTPHGGTVKLGVERLADGVRFDVVDTGCGMSADELTHAFDRLWHGAGHGPGLGLWIAKALVEAHGARLVSTSKRGAGTSMSFVLPTKRQGAPQEAPPGALVEAPAT